MMETQRRSGQALVGVLVSVFLLVAIAGIYLSTKGKNPDGSESTKTVLRRSLDLSQEVALQSNLSQIQQIIGMYKGDNEGKPPESYDELKRYAKFPAEMWINPVDKKPLDYNPQTGTMIVTPYEGMSPSIARMTAAPMGGADTPAAPSGGGINPKPPMPQIPEVPNADPNNLPEQRSNFDD